MSSERGPIPWPELTMNSSAGLLLLILPNACSPGELCNLTALQEMATLGICRPHVLQDKDRCNGRYPLCSQDAADR